MRNGWATPAAFAAMVLIGGVNFVAVRFSNRELPPFWGAGLRFVVAGLLLFAIASALRLQMPHGGALRGAMAYGALFGAAYAFAYWGMLQVPAGLAAVIFAIVPLFTFVLALTQGQERFRWRTLGGALLALAGIAVIFGQSAGLAVPVPSLLALIAAAACAAEAGIIAKRFPASHPVTMNAVGMTTGAFILVVISAISAERWALPVQANTWIALAYLIVLGSGVVFVLYLFVLKHWSASGAAYQFVLFPIVATVVARILEGTPVTLPFAAGSTLVLGGVYLGAVARAPAIITRVKVGSEPCVNCLD